MDKNVLLSASTAHIDISQLQERLFEIENDMRLSVDESTEEATCEYDLTKHIVSYLPTPIVSKHLNAPDHREKMVAKAAVSSNRHLTNNAKHLGMQSDQGVVPVDSLRSGSLRNSTMFGRLADAGIDSDPQFKSIFRPQDMRLLALVSHNNMKQSMKQFVMANMNVLKKFRLTGTNTTMSMLREVFGKDPDVVYGPSCKSGPLGGDAQLVAMAVTGQLGGCIFFIDPMDAHPHSADIECLVRQGNVHNILMMNNPCSAHICMNSLRVALKMGRPEMIPSFFFDLESPSVEAYKQRQNAVLQNAIARRTSIIASTVASTLIPTRENRVSLAMKRANEKHISFMQTNQQDGKEDFLVAAPNGSRLVSNEREEKKKFNIFHMFGACCEA